MQRPMYRSSWSAAAALWALAGVALLAVDSGQRIPAQPQGAGSSAEPDRVRGEQLYARQCAVCHGVTGAGDGPAAYLLSPAPRDFTSGRFRLASTQNGVPTVDDLIATLQRGMPGSAMPPWEWMSESDLRSLAGTVRQLAIQGKTQALLAQAEADEEDLSAEEAQAIAENWMTPGPPVALDSAPQPTAVTLQEGRRVFLKTCALCHGADGTGRGVQDQHNEDGTPTQPRDFTAGVFKGGSTQRDIVTRLRAGMAGSPMPAMSFDDPDQDWFVAAFVESLVKPGAQERVAQHRQTIRVRRATGELPRDAASAAWSQAEPVWLAVAPLWWRDERIEGLVVRALHDGSRLALRLSWEDATRDDEILGQDSFPDAASLQLSAQADPPAFTMGSKGEPVNVWQWKAAWELDLARVRDITDLRPNMPTDTYTHLVPADEPMYLAARAVGNTQATGARTSAGEILTAEGFGTLEPLAAPSGGLSARGTWADGFWDLVFTRAMPARSNAEVGLQPGRRAFLAGALFDGAHKDRNGQKSVTVWHVLEIDP